MTFLCSRWEKFRTVSMSEDEPSGDDAHVVVITWAIDVG